MKTRSAPWVVLVLSLITIACQRTEPPLPANAAKERLEKAEAMFQERCKTAGEKIHRTVDNVEGVMLMKIRPEKDNFSDQFALDDPYGSDFDGDAYIKSFLNGFFEANFKRPDVPANVVYPHVAYRYVEAIDPKDGKRYRYTGRLDDPWRYDKSYSITYKRFVLDRNPAPRSSPRYGVTYDDISTHEEREYWIARSSLKVVDLQTAEVIAERIGYL